MLGVGDDRDPAQRRHDVPHDLQPLSVEIRGHERDAGHVESRPGKAARQSGRDRIAAENVDDGHGQIELADDRHGQALRHDELDRVADELRR
jgi:hypothetical protein